MPAVLPRRRRAALNPEAAARACGNCATALAGEYCHACGQRAIEGGELTVRHALTSAADDVFHLESKTLRTFGLLFVPGLLTSRYLQGHRAPYTAPVKLYLVCAALFFVCAPLAGFTLDDILTRDSTGGVRDMVGRAIAVSGYSPDVFHERFDVRFQTVYTVGLFASVLAGALVLSLLYRRQRRPFGAHVVFELHYVSFLYLFAIILGVSLTRFGLEGPVAALVAMLALLMPFLFLALKRAYGDTLRATAWKTLVMVAFALLFDSFINVLALVVTLKLV